MEVINSLVEWLESWGLRGSPVRRRASEAQGSGCTGRPGMSQQTLQNRLPGVTFTSKVSVPAFYSPLSLV